MVTGDDDKEWKANCICATWYAAYTGICCSACVGFKKTYKPAIDSLITDEMED